MRFPRFRWLPAAALLALCAPCPAQASEPAGVRAFVNQVLVYQLANQVDLRSKEFLDVFAPRLRAAISKDMSTEDLWVIDSDFLCETQVGCDEMRILDINGTNTTAIATVQSHSINAPSRMILKWHLQRIGGEWRIADLSDSKMVPPRDDYTGAVPWPSFLAKLEASNRQH